MVAFSKEWKEFKYIKDFENEREMESETQNKTVIPGGRAVLFCILQIKIGRKMNVVRLTMWIDFLDAGK